MMVAADDPFLGKICTGPFGNHIVKRHKLPIEFKLEMDLGRAGSQMIGKRQGPAPFLRGNGSFQSVEQRQGVPDRRVDRCPCAQCEHDGDGGTEPEQRCQCESAGAQEHHEACQRNQRCRPPEEDELLAAGVIHVSRHEIPHPGRVERDLVEGAAAGLRRALDHGLAHDDASGNRGQRRDRSPDEQQSVARSAKRIRDKERDDAERKMHLPGQGDRGNCSP